jgi:hypothetical protein
MKDKIEEEENIIYLDFSVEDEEDAVDEETILKSLQGSEFSHIISHHLFTNLVGAIKKGKERFIAFRVPEYEQDYIIEKKQYKNLLNTVLTMAEEDEDYTKCATIKKLIESL